MKSAATPSPPESLAERVRILERRAKAAGDRLCRELEEFDPITYEAIYWLACGVTDYLTPLKSEDAQVEWALDVLARIPYESGQEIGELIEERRGRVSA